MNEVMKGILSRCLTEEIERQNKWKKQDIEYGFDGKQRDLIISDIRDFMETNEIPVYIKVN